MPNNELTEERKHMIYPNCFDSNVLEFKLCCSYCFNYPCMLPNFCEKAKNFVKKNTQAAVEKYRASLPKTLEELIKNIVELIGNPCERCDDDDFDGKCPYYKKDPDIEGYYCDAPSVEEQINNLISDYTQQQVAEARKEERERWEKTLNLFAASTDPVLETIPVFGGKSKEVLCRRFRIPEPDWQALKEVKE